LPVQFSTKNQKIETAPNKYLFIVITHLLAIRLITVDRGLTKKRRREKELTKTNKANKKYSHETGYAKWNQRIFYDSHT